MKQKHSRLFRFLFQIFFWGRDGLRGVGPDLIVAWILLSPGGERVVVPFYVVFRCCAFWSGMALIGALLRRAQKSKVERYMEQKQAGQERT